MAKYTPNYITVPGVSSMTATPFYRGVLQCERIIPRKEAYKLLSGQLGLTATVLSIGFRGFSEALKEKVSASAACVIDGIGRVQPKVKGSFDFSHGPWVKGRNYLEIGVNELDPFKSTLAGVVPKNRTAGADPTINSVIDTVTGEFDVITGTDEFSFTGRDLAPDTDKDDEYVALADKNGVEVAKAPVSLSTLGNVVAALETAIDPGEYTLCCYTRSGMGAEFGVKCAKRKVTVK